MTDRTTSSILIGAPPDVIMPVIADFAAYPDWAAGVRAATVLASGGDGRAELVRFRLEAGPIRDSYVLRYEWDGNAGVRWELAEAGSVITELSGRYLLAGRGSQTEVTYELAAGVRIPMPGIMKRRAERSIIEAALNGLRKRAETQGARA